MQLSIIILNYNVRYFLELCVLSVQSAIRNIDAEIIVVDNSSPDDSCQMMRERFPDVILIENTENTGFPRGNNIGVAAARGEYVCILNPDTVVAEDTFEKLLAFAASKTDLGIVGCRLLDGRGNFLPESKRGIPTPFAAFAKISGLYKIFPNSRRFNRYYASHIDEHQTGRADILVGAFMLLKKELYVEAGGFDERYFMYGEDIDFSFSVLNNGKKNYYFHDTAVIHYKGESTVKDRNYMKRFQQGMELFYEKHGSASAFFSTFMKAGMFFFSFLKAFRAKAAPFPKPERYCLVTGNLDSGLLKILEERLQASVAVCSEDAGPDRTEFIIDIESVGFKKAIDFIASPGRRHCTFKMLLKKSNYLIGSNSSSDRGEVVRL
ncbi:MAG TPA: glycosyltransferase family 2 protein [Flavobacterium sp.]|nr:glycosyltransferase family 2 protein [Flavobacterium sp.]